MQLTYQPFRNFDFHYRNCFLSGNTFRTPVVQIPVIPEWLMGQAGLTGEEPIKLLDESIRSYRSLQLPVNAEVNTNFLEPLEAEIAAAFAGGYDALSRLDERKLFHWLGKFIYGFVYVEMNAALRQNGRELNMSQSLMMKFGNLHMHLQGIYSDVVFENVNPWSIVLTRLSETDVPFSFRDEINTLTFSLRFKDFGIVACLQDNGANKKYHDTLLDNIAGETLTLQQFEELSARFYYSAYLFNRLPDYTTVPLNGTTYIEAMPLRGASAKPLFDHWQHKTYGQVLENFWKPWGLTLFEIIKNPEQPLSFFEDPALPAT
ncbi:hypothetical protein C7T94_03515 [Pedobacter yulinensis]|uniref:Uncharacterized protein n=1 Tax=Pedobacter yulinensis TaxID=2126353 RepID=A0A2T3HRU4_9SPHI|nr:hypothetical protein [Pedobacter yulinensis]PST85185.1 hypothetical protein C7T94_03515 [Pedobacter yulinensis]